MLRVPLLVKSRFRNWDGEPAGDAGKFKNLSGICVNCGWFNTLKASQRNSNRFVSAKRNDLKTVMSKLLMPPARSVLRPTVEALGSPIPWTQWTSPGVTHMLVSGFRYPVAQAWDRTARLL